MAAITKLINLYFSDRLREIDYFREHPAEVQERQFRYLLANGAKTEFGRDLGMKGIATQQLFRGFMHSLGERTEGNDFNKGALDCALGIVNRDARYLGIYEFCVWYYKLLKKEGLIDEGPVQQP